MGNLLHANDSFLCFEPWQNSAMCPVSRITGQVRSITHDSGKRTSEEVLHVSGKRARRERVDYYERRLNGGAMGRDCLPLPILPDEGIGENYFGGERLSFEVSGLRGTPGHDRSIAVIIYPHL